MAPVRWTSAAVAAVCCPINSTSRLAFFCRTASHGDVRRARVGQSDGDRPGKAARADDHRPLAHEIYLLPNELDHGRALGVVAHEPIALA